MLKKIKSRYTGVIIKMILSFFVIVIITQLISCDTTEPPKPDSRKLTLTFEDASCTEVWLKLRTENISFPSKVIVIKDSLGAKVISLTNIDTTIYIDSLLPGNTYNFRVSLSTGGPLTSNEVTAATMDTTSHNFTWQTWTFGGGGEASFINDVAIVDENNIWAVGEIYLPDSLGNPDIIPYNVIHWDGENWKPQKVTVNFRGNLITPVLYGIFAFPLSQIWLAGGLAIYGDGNNWTLHDVRLITGFDTLSLQKCWGVNPSKMYFVGRAGSLALYQDENWQRIESGTRTPINDIWGIKDNNNEGIVYSPVSSFFTPGDKKILRIKNSMVDSVSWNINRLLYSVWTNSERYLYACGSGVFENKNGNWEEIPLQPISTNRIRGNGANDIFVAGDFGFTAHFNGVSWITYNSLYDNNTAYYSLDIKNSIVVLVGYHNGKGIITVGRGTKF
jgi:hypothetical protein